MVEERWGYPFWEVVRDFAEQGLDRAKVSRALGMNYNHLNVLLNDHPESDPFPPSNRQVAYLRDTGETFKAAVLRLNAEGVGVEQAARELGFYNGTCLRRHLQDRGMAGLFVKVNRVKAYCQQHGVTLGEALKALRDQRLSKTAAAKVLGFNRISEINQVMAEHGLPWNYFRQRPKRERSVTTSSARHPWVEDEQASYQRRKSMNR